MIPIPKMPNYYPWANQGITIKMAGKIDPWRMYYNKAKYEIRPLYLISGFDTYTSEGILFLLFFSGGLIDHKVITSLN